MSHTDETLNDLQGKVEVHFRSLAEKRERFEFPIFALEHGLSPMERGQVNDLLRERCRAKLPLEPYWLLCTVYASEFGYSYNGDEYWPPFEEKTPNWVYNDRPNVKNWFRKFQESFNGVVPTGSWAKHFRIIAWPITHALLPKYLQCQFVKLLYDLRHLLVSDLINDAGSIGRLLDAHAPHASTRLQVFLEQRELTGQIAAALLREQSVDDDHLIHRPTLTRIVEDLESVRRSRDWLKETRRVVSDRFKDIGSGTYPPAPETTSTRPGDTALSEFSKTAIRPKLILRHTGSDKWIVVLQLKSMSPIADESLELREFINRTRCRMRNTAGWKPVGWLLSGDRQSSLKCWPDVDLPLIEFERSNPLMDHLLESDYRLTQRPVWLFRIGSDGIAHHIGSSVVRPGNGYIVVSAESMSLDQPELSPCALDCADVHAYRLAVPSHVSDDFTNRLGNLGLQVARTIRVWPAGLPGRGWDGEGSTEWLITESPCFGIEPDHPLKALSFRLNGEPEQIIPTDPSGGPTFIRLPHLPAGNHDLIVRAHRSPELDDVKGWAKLMVRKPELWISDVASHPGLIVTTDPSDENLDILWRNELDLSISGPKDFTVSVRLSLYTADGDEILSDVVNSSMDLPITPDIWRRVFSEFPKSENRSRKYLEATTCFLEINGDSLGICKLRFNRKLLPLRWVWETRQNQTFIRLVDDSGQHDTVPDVQFFSMKHPLRGEPLDIESVRMNFSVQPPGGLYVARHAPFEDAAFVSALPHRAGLRALDIEHDVNVQPGLPAIREAFRLLRLWKTTRQAESGFLVDDRRRRVIDSIISAIVMKICGEKWERSEGNFVRQPSPNSIKTLESLVEKRSSFGSRLNQRIEPGESDDAVADRFAEEAGREGLAKNRELCDFVLRLAAHEDAVLSDPLPDERISQLIGNPALLRGARLVVLLCKHREDQPVTSAQSRNP